MRSGEGAKLLPRRAHGAGKNTREAQCCEHILPFPLETLIVLPNFIEEEYLKSVFSVCKADAWLVYMQDSNTSLGSLQQLVQVKTGLPPSRQTLVISEDRARRYGFTDSVWRAKTQLSTARQDMRAFFISSINFIFLPESLNRSASLQAHRHFGGALQDALAK